MIVRFLSRDLFTVTILRFPVKLSALVFLSLKHVSTMFCLTAHFCYEHSDNMDTMACPLVSVLTELHCIRIFLNLSSIFHGS